MQGINAAKAAPEIKKGQKYQHIQKRYKVEIVEVFKTTAHEFEKPQVLMKLDLKGNYYARCPMDEFINNYELFTAAPAAKTTTA